MRKLSRLFWLLLAATPLWAALWLYAFTAALPFFLDDGPNFHFTSTINGLEQWGGSLAFPYYRPVAFSIWKLNEYILGTGYDAVALHLVNVFLLGIAGVIFGLLIRRIIPPPNNRLVGVLAGVGFVLFPFNYQAVTLVSGLFHISLTFGIVFSLWLALCWLDGRGGRLALVGCWLGAFVGVFSHENGPLIVPLLLGLLYVHYRGRWPTLKQLALVVLPVSAIAGVYTLLWFVVPRFNTGIGLQLSAEPLTALAALSQGLIYPFAALLRPLFAGDITPIPLLILVGILIAAGLMLVWWQSRKLMIVALFSLFWYVLAIIPSTMLLDAGYVLGSPRLMYLASLGGSAFWVIVFLALFYPRPAYARYGRFAAVAAAVLFVSVAVNFIRLRRDDFLKMGTFTNELLQLVAANDVAATGGLIINAPQYIAPEPQARTFLLGAEGVIFMEDELNYDQQFWLNLGERFPLIDMAAFPAVLHHQGFIYKPNPPQIGQEELVARLRTAPQIIVVTTAGAAFWPEYVGRAGLPGPDAPVVQFPEIDYSLLQARARLLSDNTTIQLQTRWQATASQPVKLFVHVLCDGEMVGQADGYVWGNLYPFAMWEPGEIQTDYRQIRLNRAISSACLQVYTGLYWENDGQRLDAISTTTSETLVDNLVPVPLVTELPVQH